jgi:hypothetical protein
VFVNVLQAYVSLKRIDKFLAEEETHKYSVLSEVASEDDPKIGFVDASFTWADEEKAREDPSVFRVSGLDFAFPEGCLSIILGPGKFSALELEMLQLISPLQTQSDPGKPRFSCPSSEKRIALVDRLSSLHPSSAPSLRTPLFSPTLQPSQLSNLSSSARQFVTTFSSEQE